LNVRLDEKSDSLYHEYATSVERRFRIGLEAMLMEKLPFGYIFLSGLLLRALSLRHGIRNCVQRLLRIHDEQQTTSKTSSLLDNMRKDPDYEKVPSGALWNHVE
jgi:hypothetical protein